MVVEGDKRWPQRDDGGHCRPSHNESVPTPGITCSRWFAHNPVCLVVTLLPPLATMPPLPTNKSMASGAMYSYLAHLIVCFLLVGAEALPALYALVGELYICVRGGCMYKSSIAEGPEVLVRKPALVGSYRDWGCTSFRKWRRITVPVLFEALLSKPHNGPTLPGIRRRGEQEIMEGEHLGNYRRTIVRGL